jgi:lipid-binding SYLF domain-containing protein
MHSTKVLFALVLVVASFSLAAGEPQKESGEAKQSDETKQSHETKQSDEAKRVDNATTVVNEFAGMSEGPPQSLVEGAAGVVVLPGLIKAGLGIGGKHGKGVLTIKNQDGSWTEPVFVKMTGASVGFQIGASSTDLVLLFMREKNIRDVLNGEFTLGANASVAAGPVGRTGSADTSIKMDAEIFSYSRSRGAFAGISLDGSKLYVDNSANEAFYGKEATPKSIVSASGKADSTTAHFRAALAQLTKARE